MAGKYDVNKAMELLFDDEISLSDGEISEEESEDAYCYRVKAYLTKKSFEEASWFVIIMASLWINQRIKVKEKLELLFRGILG